MAAVKETMLGQIAELFDDYEPDMVSILDRAKKEKIGVGFHLTIDDSKSEVIVETSIAFGEKYGNKKVAQLDPGQGKFMPILDEAKKGKNKSDDKE